MTETPPNDQTDFAVTSVDRLEETVDECPFAFPSSEPPPLKRKAK